MACYSETYPTQDIEYSQVCGRIIGYQVGAPEAFIDGICTPTIDKQYVNGVSLTYGMNYLHHRPPSVRFT